MKFRKLYILLALIPASAMAAPAEQGGTGQEPMTREQAQTQSSHANSLRKQARAMKSEAEAIRRRDYDACLSKFLVNSCRDDVQDTFIGRMGDVRKLEIQANKLDRVAKARLKELDDEERQPPKPGGKPQSTDGENPQSAPKPLGKPRTTSNPRKTPPSPKVSAAAQARADAERKRAVQAAEQQKSANGKAAAKRAEEAAKDRARYDQRMREHAEKMAKKKTKGNSSSASTKALMDK